MARVVFNFFSYDIFTEHYAVQLEIVQNLGNSGREFDMVFGGMLKTKKSTHTLKSKQRMFISDP